MRKGDRLTEAVIGATAQMPVPKQDQTYVAGGAMRAPFPRMSRPPVSSFDLPVLTYQAEWGTEGSRPSRKRSASSAAIQPLPAEVIA